ncbi:IS66 family insertion sequence element accessory protein TnpA [Myxococcus xanthus]|uniref:IS66 family insertion sequence element accessory protein TnpA n=1 Tax=Myxococcus xanthus TaxID=34 RepID=UPI003AB8F988
MEKQEWFRVAEAFEASGLTQKAFSSQRGLRLSTLQSWVYRRRKRPANDVLRGVEWGVAAMDPGAYVEAGGEARVVPGRRSI